MTSCPSLRIVVITVLVGVLGACAGTGTELHRKRLSKNTTLVHNTADLRVVAVTKQHYVGDKRFPKEIVCTEPSPDVAKAVAEAVGLGSGITINLPPTGATPEIAASLATAYSNSRAESMAQLTQRLATIQLLRDGLFRACEAYANGAIDERIYSVLVSRYDDTMVTLLLGEIAGGSVPGTLATLSSEAQGKATANASQSHGAPAPPVAPAEAVEAQREVTEAQGEMAQAQEAMAEAADAAVAADTPAEAQQAAQQVETAENAVEQAQRNLNQAVDAMAETMVKATATPATVGGSGNAAVAETLGTMQRKFIENINFDSLRVACLTAVGDPDPKFFDVCFKPDVGPIDKTLAQDFKVLDSKIARRSKVTEIEAENSTVAGIKKAIGDIKAIDGEVSGIVTSRPSFAEEKKKREAAEAKVAAAEAAKKTAEGKTAAEKKAKEDALKKVAELEARLKKLEEATKVGNAGATPPKTVDQTNTGG